MTNSQEGGGTVQKRRACLGGELGKMLELEDWVGFLDKIQMRVWEEIRVSYGWMDGWEGKGAFADECTFPALVSRRERECCFVYLVHVRHLSMDLLGWVGGREGRKGVGNDMVLRCSI